MAENTNEAWEEQKQTYATFLSITKWSVVGLAITVVLLFLIVQP